MVWTCKHFDVGAAVDTLMVLLLLPFSLAMDDGEFDHGGGSGGGGGPEAAATGAAVDNDWRLKWPAMKAFMVT